MAKTKDPFSITITLRHPSYSPDHISQVLALKPDASWAVGQRMLKSRAKWTYFYARLQKGDHASNFEAALRKVVLFLKKNDAFLTGFLRGHGEVELTMNHTIHVLEEEGDKNFELHLSPEFLDELSTRGIGLSVQGWQGGCGRVSGGSTKQSGLSQPR